MLKAWAEYVVARSQLAHPVLPPIALKHGLMPLATSVLLSMQ